MQKEQSNFVILEGPVDYPNFRTVGDNVSLFKGKVAGVNIVAWRGNADALNEVPKDIWVKIHGHIEEKSYEQIAYT